jgi:catechol 2,3-dioxygenase-like lactoylglutathione lyase family enzyme
MISGAHVVIYSKDAEADRSFFRDVLGFKSVDAGHGWLIFGLPPREAAFHPSADNAPHELYHVRRPDSSDGFAGKPHLRD